MGTLQLEFRELSRVTGNSKYSECAMKVYRKLREINPPNGLYTAFISFFIYFLINFIRIVYFNF